MKNIVEVRNIDDVVIWSNSQDRSFLSFMKLIFNENEAHTDIEDRLPPLTTDIEAYSYFNEYCELYPTYND